jgi:hypothetical protein
VLDHQPLCDPGHTWGVAWSDNPASTIVESRCRHRHLRRPCNRPCLSGRLRRPSSHLCLLRQGSSNTRGAWTHRTPSGRHLGREWRSGRNLQRIVLVKHISYSSYLNNSITELVKDVTWLMQNRCSARGSNICCCRWHRICRSSPRERTGSHRIDRRLHCTIILILQ